MESTWDTLFQPQHETVRAAVCLRTSSEDGGVVWELVLQLLVERLQVSRIVLARKNRKGEKGKTAIGEYEMVERGEEEEGWEAVCLYVVS